jgi:hypothetical protein
MNRVHRSLYSRDAPVRGLVHVLSKQPSFAAPHGPLRSLHSSFAAPHGPWPSAVRAARVATGVVSCAEGSVHQRRTGRSWRRTGRSQRERNRPQRPTGRYPAPHGPVRSLQASFAAHRGRVPAPHGSFPAPHGSFPAREGSFRAPYGSLPAQHRWVPWSHRFLPSVARSDLVIGRDICGSSVDDRSSRRTVRSRGAVDPAERAPTSTRR